jgi:hypothetical protein
MEYSEFFFLDIKDNCSGALKFQFRFCFNPLKW